MLHTGKRVRVRNPGASRCLGPGEADRAASETERAVLAFIQPKLLTTERDFVAQNEFQVTFRPYDWSLNDLTGRGGR